jgi:hypothetical protein
MALRDLLTLPCRRETSARPDPRGEFLDVECSGVWYPAKIVSLHDACVKVHYMGWSARHDELLSEGSARLRRLAPEP